MTVYAFEENIFPLPKEKMPQYEEWTEEEKGGEYTPLKEDQKLLLKKKGL